MIIKCPLTIEFYIEIQQLPLVRGPLNHFSGGPTSSPIPTGGTSDELRANLLDIHNQRLDAMNKNGIDFVRAISQLSVHKIATALLIPLTDGPFLR